MNPQLKRILEDENLRREEFPVVRNKVFLAHAAVAPLPRRVASAVANYAVACAEGDQEAQAPEGILHRTRVAAAGYLGCKPTEIALVGPTSTALSYVAAGLTWAVGENVVLYEEDYPSNVYPWLSLRERGVEIRSVRPPGLGAITWEDVRAQLDEHTRLVALASCHFLSGFRIDVDQIGRELRSRGILFCVDAIQTLGAWPTPVTHVDFLAADAHKWLLGPCAAGLLYVSETVRHLLRPVVYGWHNARCPQFVALDSIELRDDARRYEAGSANLLGVVGLNAAIELMEAYGPEAISLELLRKRRLLVDGLAARGWEVIHPSLSSANASCIVSFSRPEVKSEAVTGKLERAGVVASLRMARGGRAYVRWSPHFYNTDRELELALDATS